jgi:hypothetical protein
MGEKNVNALESNFEMFVILKNEGTGGLWKFIQGQIGDLKVMVIDTIQNFIIEKVIVSGITWILSLLNPASAFVRACKAIIDIIMFFIERASQIAELINAIIEAVTAIASGAIGGAAKAIENALSKSLPVVISFMASLLGIGGISDKVQEVIKRVSQPIEKAINWVIEQAVKFAKKLGLGKDNKNKDGKADERTEQAKKADLDKAVGEAEVLLKNKEMSSDEVKERLPAIKFKYKMTSLELVTDSETDSEEIVHIEAKINPSKTGESVKKAKPEDVINALENWPSRTFQFGSFVFLLDKKGMKHILQRHHPEFWDGSVKHEQSFFKGKESIDEIANAIGEVLKQNRDKLMEKGANRTYQIEGTYKGVNYVLGINRGRVGQFYSVE